MWLILVILALLLLLTRKEGFSVQFKADLGSFDGVSKITSLAASHATRFHDAFWESIPFKAQIRTLRRNLRRRKNV